MCLRDVRHPDYLLASGWRSHYSRAGSGWFAVQIFLHLSLVPISANTCPNHSWLSYKTSKQRGKVTRAVSQASLDR